jgi:hypothetical protein
MGRATTGRLSKVIEMVAESVGVTVPQALKIYEKEQYAYFGAITTDNHYLPPEYVNNLIATYPEKWLRRYVYNSWDNFEGLVYSEFHSRCVRTLKLLMCRITMMLIYL